MHDHAGRYRRQYNGRYQRVIDHASRGESVHAIGREVQCGPTAAEEAAGKDQIFLPALQHHAGADHEDADHQRQRNASRRTELRRRIGQPKSDGDDDDQAAEFVEYAPAYQQFPLFPGKSLAHRIREREGWLGFRRW